MLALFIKSILLFIVCLVLLTVFGIVLGILFNKYVIKKLSGIKRKILCALTIVIFLFSSISISCIIGAKIHLNSMVDYGFKEIEKYMYETYSENEYIASGIDLNKVKDYIIQEIKQNLPDKLDDFSDDEKVLLTMKVISDIRSMMPANVAPKFDRKIFDMALNVFSKQSEVIKYAKIIFSLADKNGVVTVSSFLTNSKVIVKKAVTGGYNKVIIFLIIPSLLYIIASYVYILIVIKKEKQPCSRNEENGEG